jgi:DNA helicase-2/ATP-dependent DNA helicase PcrA
MALEIGLPFRAPKLRFLSEDCRVDAILEAARTVDVTGESPLQRLVEVAVSGEEPATASAPATGPAAEADARDPDEPLPVETAALVAAMVGWAAPYRSLSDLAAAIEEHRARIAELRRDDASLTLATAHSTKGLEFDHVAVVGLDAGRFPSARSLREAPEPGRALEEERRLAYVAWTRARRSLTLVYDPASPSPFLLEAFSDVELNLDPMPC